MNAGIILIIAFISAGLGYLAGLLLTRRGSQDSDIQTEAGGNATPRFESHKLNVTLWSKTAHGPLAADLYGKTFINREEVSDADKNRLVQDIRTIEAWFGISTAKSITVNGTPLQAGSPQKPQLDRSNEIPPLPITPIAQQEEPLPPPSPVVEPTQVDPEAVLAEMDAPAPVIAVPARLDNRSKVKPPEPKSIVQQINDILQDKVVKSDQPDIAIKLQETPQGVLVWVGNHSFQGIDAVPDGSAKEMIKAAVKEWEKR
jgi:hypothetical protein